MSEAASAVCCRSNLPPAKGTTPHSPNALFASFQWTARAAPALALQLQTEEFMDSAGHMESSHGAADRSTHQ